MWKKTGIVLSSIGVFSLVVVGGLWYAKEKATEAMGQKIAQTLKDPSTQKQIQSLISEMPQSPQVTGHGSGGGAVTTSSTTSGSSTDLSYSGTTGSTSSEGSSQSGESSGNAAGSQTEHRGSTASTSGLHFANEQQAINYAMSKFTPGQIAHFMAVYADRGKLNGADKEAVKQQILSHFTPSELAAMEAAVNS